jgi:hypothetical protein
MRVVPISHGYGLARVVQLGLGLEKASSDCIAGKFDAVSHAQFFEHVGAVAFNGFDADDEDACDLL